MLQNPHLMHSRQQRHFTTQPHSHSSGIQLPQPMQQSHYHRQEQHSHPSQQHSSSGTTDLQSKYFHRFNATHVYHWALQIFYKRYSINELVSAK